MNGGGGNGWNLVREKLSRMNWRGEGTTKNYFFCLSLIFIFLSWNWLIFLLLLVLPHKSGRRCFATYGGIPITALWKILFGLGKSIFLRNDIFVLRFSYPTIHVFGVLSSFHILPMLEYYFFFVLREPMLELYSHKCFYEILDYIIQKLSQLKRPNILPLNQSMWCNSSENRRWIQI